jgi:hypothetical protein
MTWVFLVIFPILMGAGPVPVAVSGVSRPHCERLRALFADQLAAHLSTAAVSPKCFQAPALVSEPKGEKE